MDDFIEEYQLELVDSRIVENESILYPYAIAYYVVLLCRKTQMGVSFTLYFNQKYGDLSRQDDTLKIYLWEIGDILLDGLFETYEIWMGSGGGDQYLKTHDDIAWTKERYPYSRKVYEDFGALVGEDGREELINA